MFNSSLFRRLRASTLAFVLSGFAAAQAVSPGDLVLYSPAIFGISSGSGGIVRIDPLTGSVSTVLALQGASQSTPGSMAYDAFRDRFIFVGAPTSGSPVKLWLMDRSAALTDLGLLPGQFDNFTSGSGGKIYLRSSWNGPFGYLDAANVYHTLMDASGSAPFQTPVVDVRSMIYDAGTNALFMPIPSGSGWDCGSPLQVSIHRVRLSADGTRALGVDACAEVFVDPTGQNAPVGLSHGPNGQLVMTIDNNNGSSLPRMNLIDPISLAVTPYAWNSNPSAAATNAGAYSAVLGKHVILDAGGDVLIAFGQGESGSGSAFTPVGSVSAPFSSHETATLIEVPPSICSAQIATYCTAKTSSSGCVPVITTAGCPSMSAGSGFVVSAAQVEQGKNGLYFYSLQGQAALPFQGGWLCVKLPTHRTGVVNAGGSTTCGGNLSIDLNTWAASGADPALGVGSVVAGQFWFRDPSEPVSGTGLSGGVTFTFGP